MSRTYEALRRAANGRRAAPATGTAPRGAQPAARAGAPVHWELGGPRDVEYQRLRVWLTGAAARGETIKTVLVVGCHSRGGATTTAALLASTLSDGKRLRVLLVDANFRTPALGSIFDVRGGDGLGNVLDEGFSMDRGVHPTRRTNLSVVPAGPGGHVPVEIFEGQAIDALLAEAKSRFDFVIIDGAPVLDFPDAHALAPKVDGLVLVVEADGTPVDEAQRAKRVIEEAGGRLLGVILNRQREYVPRLVRRVLGISG